MSRLILLAVALCGACAETDPLLREGVWRPNGANRADLARMVAAPSDLVRGHGAATADGELAAAAVARLRADAVKPLPASGLTEIKLGAEPPTQAAPAPADPGAAAAAAAEP